MFWHWVSPPFPSSSHTKLTQATLHGDPNLTFFSREFTDTLPHVTCSVQEVRESKIDYTNAEPEERNSAVGWH